MKKIDEIHSITEKGLIEIMGKSEYKDKLKEAKQFLLLAKQTTKSDLSYKEIAAERINWLNNYAKLPNNYGKKEKTIDNGLFMNAGIELDD